MTAQQLTVPSIIRTVRRGTRDYWLIEGLASCAVWVTRQLPDPEPFVALEDQPVDLVPHGNDLPTHHFGCALVTRGGGCTCGAIDYQQTADHVGSPDA